MSIKGNIGTGVIDIIVGDTTIYDPPATVQRYAVSAFSVHNKGAATETVTVYVSPNLTSASGDLVAQYSIPGFQSVDIVELIGQGFGGALNIIAISTGTNCNAMMSVTTYDGGD